LDYFDEVNELNDMLRTIYSAEAKDFPKVLDALTQAAARCVAGADHAGITASGRENEVSSPSVTDDCAKVLDEIQARHLEGPCLEAAWTRKAVEVEDLATDSRWPKYRSDALAETPIRSVLSLPLFADELSMGRDTIGQAKGILMERYELDEQAAFNMLVKLSQGANTAVRDIARRLIDDAGI